METSNVKNVWGEGLIWLIPIKETTNPLTLGLRRPFVGLIFIVVEMYRVSDRAAFASILLESTWPHDAKVSVVNLGRAFFQESSP